MTQIKGRISAHVVEYRVALWMPSKPNEPAPRGPGTKGGPLGAALSLGLELAVAMLVGVVGGRWADEKLGTSPALLLAGVAAGFGSGLYLLIRGVEQAKTRRR